MDGKLKKQEDSYLSHVLSEIKMNYIEEKKRGDLPEEKKEKNTDTAETKPKSDEKTNEKNSGKNQTKAKTATAKTKEKK